ncbi:leucine-rich repeat extensin-like protein 5 [Lucilia sericata]|uniref:leucine-rich repeat extensin-like protein 5 n=1 Tax=Lucilia sericata TaxID=13632 RepID=UPI0018A81C06|nr:leucine-rich repeat extensin-like protein 5 [Lucilia sericata]
MSGQQPPPNGPRGWNPRVASPSTFMYRPPSPWTPVAPSPPPIISGPRRPSMPSPAPMSPTPFAHAMSPGPSNLRGTRGTNNMPHPRPQWPQQPPLAGNMSPAPYQPPTFQPSFYPNQQQAPLTQLPPKVCPSPTAYVGANGPRPFRPLTHQNSYGGDPTSSFQLSPTPSPIVCQTPNSEFMYGSNRQTPMSHAYETQQQQYPRQQQHYAPPPPSMQQQQQQRPQSQNQYDFVGVPLEPPQPKSYVIYDDEEEYGPSTAEIIANQSQDYVDEKLAEYQMTILQLQGQKGNILISSLTIP